MQQVYISMIWRHQLPASIPLYTTYNGNPVPNFPKKYAERGFTTWPVKKKTHIKCNRQQVYISMMWRHQLLASIPLYTTYNGNPTTNNRTKQHYYDGCCTRNINILNILSLSLLYRGFSLHSKSEHTADRCRTTKHSRKNLPSGCAIINFLFLL